MPKKQKLTIKQKKFADYYIETGNATESAIRAGYSKKTAAVTGCENLIKPNIKSYIENHMKKLENAKIADQKEVLEYLTKVLRGEIKEEVLIGTGMGEQETIEVAIPTRERTKAAELLGKRYGVFKSDDEKAEIKAKVSKVNAEVDKIKGISEEVEDLSEIEGAIYDEKD